MASSCRPEDFVWLSVLSDVVASFSWVSIEMIAIQAEPSAWYGGWWGGKRAANGKTLQTQKSCKNRQTHKTNATKKNQKKTRQEKNQSAPGHLISGMDWFCGMIKDMKKKKVGEVPLLSNASPTFFFFFLVLHHFFVCSICPCQPP